MKGLNAFLLTLALLVPSAWTLADNEGVKMYKQGGGGAAAQGMHDPQRGGGRGMDHARDRDRRHDMQGLMDQQRERLREMARLMEGMGEMNREQRRQMSQIMQKLAQHMRQMARHMEKGMGDEKQMKSMHQEMEQVRERIRNLQAQQE